MRKRFGMFLGVLLVVVGLSNPIHATAQGIQRLTADQGRMIEEYVERERKASRIPGIAIGIVYGDRIVYTKGFGVADEKGTPVTPDTPFYIGSIGKTFTALAIRQLEGEGRLDSKELVTKYIPWFTLADGSGKQITVEDLLAHTSGLSTAAGNEAYSYQSHYSIEEAVQQINNRAKLNRPVGAGYEYSNLNYVILGLIVEYVSGMKYEDYLQQNIYAPIQMSHSYVSKEDAKASGLAEGFRELYGINIRIDSPYPAGQVPAGYQLCSATDMAKYMVYFLNNGYAEGKSLLPNNSLTPVADPLKPFDSGDSYYSLDWGVTKDPAIHDYNRFYGFLGATPNFNSAMLLSQVHRYGIVVLVNQRGSYRKPELMSQIIGNGISDILLHNRMPESIQRTYDRKVFFTPLLLLIITALSIYSCLRLPKRLLATRQWIVMMNLVIIHIALPATILIALPIYYDANWMYFLSSGIDFGLPMLALSIVLIIIGIIKAIRIFMYGKKHRKLLK